MKLQHEDYGFELKILGYQFPGETRDVDDMNWLYIKGHVSHPRGSWTFHDSCLMTLEVLRLAKWLESIAKGETVDLELSFIEPNLSFRLGNASQKKYIRIYFELESRPPWAQSKASGCEDVWVEFSVSNRDFLAGAASLNDQLINFPPRTHGTD